MTFANTILMMRPAQFGYNIETADSNPFQDIKEMEDIVVSKKALQEFDCFVEILRGKGVEVIVEHDTDYPIKPDAIFPNNWISFHADGTLVVYPMYAPNRRKEIRWDIVERMKELRDVRRVLDLSDHVVQKEFLEGTGSVVFDHKHKVAYACASPRTNKKLFYMLCDSLAYRPVYFHAVDEAGVPIYHANVMMCMGNDFVVLCKDSIAQEAEREAVCASLLNTGYELIEISMHQMKNFAGKMLMLESNTGRRLLILSERAYQCLTSGQIERMESDCELVSVSMPTIEMVGGGSARCMLTEVFLEKNERD